MADPIQLTPAEQQEYEQKAGAGPAPVNPLRDLSAGELSDLAVKDPTFDIGAEWSRNPDLHGDTAITQKAADALHAVRQRGFSVSDLPGPKKIAQNVWDVAKGFGKQAWNYAQATIGVPLASAAGELTGQPPSFHEELGKLGQRQIAENIAGTEQAVTTTAGMAARAAQKIGRHIPVAGPGGAFGYAAKPLAEYTPEDKVRALFDAAGTAQQSAEIARGHGGFLSPVGGEVIKELEQSGKPVRPEETAVTAAGDPFSWWAFGKVFQGAQGLVPAGVAKTGAKVTAALGEKTAQAGGATISALGAPAELVGKTTEVVAPVVKVAAPIAVVGKAAVEGQLPSIETLLAGGYALKNLEHIGEAARSFGAKAYQFGQEVAGKTPVTSAYAQGIRDVLQAAPGAVGDLTKGAAFDIGTAATTAETPADTQGVGLGTAFGLLGGAKRVGGQVLSGQLIAPREYGIAQPQPSSGNFKSLDALHNAAFGAAAPGVRARINAIRQFVRGAAPGTDVFLAGNNPDALSAALQERGLSKENADQWADPDQNGFFMGSLPGDNGQPRRVIIVNNPDAAPHESFHAIQDVLGEGANQKIDDIVRQNYAGEWEQQGEAYAKRWQKGPLGNATWRERILDLSGWGVNAAKEKIYRDIGNRMRADTPGAEPPAGAIRALAQQEFGRLMDEALSRNSTLSPEEVQSQVWRDVLSPDEANNVADRYLARELAAENFDAAFKRGKVEGLPGILAQKVGNLVSMLGGNPLAGRVSQIGQIAPKLGVVEAVRGAVPELPTVAPLKPAPKPAIAAPRPVPGTPEARTANAQEAQQAADAAPETPLAGGTRSPRELLGQIAEAIARGTGIKINYLSAPDEPAAATTSNREIRRAIIEVFRTMPAAARALWEKSFFPDRVITTKGGQYQVQGWAPEVFAANAHKMAQTLSKLGAEGAALSPYPLDPATGSFTEEGWKNLYQDATRFIANQQAGFTGSGVPLVVPKEMEARGIYKPQVTGTAAPMEQRTADFINTLFNFKLPETPRIQKGKIPLNIAGQEVSAATLPGRVEVPVRPRGEYTGAEAEKQGIEGRPIAEVNPVRNAIEAAAQKAGVAMPSMIEAIQKLNLENIKEVAHAPEMPEFRGNTLTLTAGFQPKAPSVHDEPESIKRAAVRASSGKIYDGFVHGDARQKAIDVGEDPAGLKSGFVTNAGEFLDRKQAYRRAVQQGQLTGDEFTPIPGSLESVSFDMAQRRQGYGQAQPAPPPIEAVNFMRDASDAEFAAATRNFKGAYGGGPTGWAFEVGSQARTPEDLAALKSAAEEHGAAFKQALASGDINAIGAAQTSVLKKQLAREAYEAATGRKIDTDEPTDASVGFIRKYADPNYNPPMGQAQPPARNEEVNKVAENYLGHPLPTSSYATLSPENAKRIADYYESAKHDPNNAEVQKSYSALAQETEAQYRAITDAGYTIEPFTGKGEPYANSDAMRADVNDNKHLFFLPSASASDASADNLMMRPSGIEFNGKSAPVNDIFRAVHDFFGHAKEGYQFGPRGEYNAWREHSGMYSPEAQGALAAETLAQNAWVNFGPHLRDEAGNVAARGEPGFVEPTARPFAEQKNIVIPPEIRGQAQPEKEKLRGGAAFAKFFHATENTPAGGAKFNDVSDVLQKPVGDYKPELDAYLKFGSNFQKHIFTSIPGFIDARIRLMRGLEDYAESVGNPRKPVRMLDITSSEGYFPKAWAEQTQKRGVPAEADALDALPAFKTAFEKTPQVPGVNFKLAAWGEGFTDPTTGQQIPAFNTDKKYDIIHEGMGFQFFTPDRENNLDEVKRMLQPNGVFITLEKFKNPDYAEREKLKNEYKSQFYSGEQLAAKQKDVLGSENENAVGMDAYQIDRQQYENILADKWKHVKQIWSSGNFAGYVASDSPEAVDKIVSGMGDTTTKFSVEDTPRDISGQAQPRLTVRERMERKGRRAGAGWFGRQMAQQQQQPQPTDEGPPKTYIIRHGSTALNNADPTKDKIRGHMDVPLSAKGRAEAEETAKQLENSGIKKIYASDLERTMDTALALQKTTGAPIVPDENLRPWKFGPTIEGHPTADVLPKIQSLIDNPDTRPEGGETFNEFKDRFLDAFHRIQDAHPDEHTAIVTHYRGTKLLDSWRKTGTDNDTIDMADFAAQRDTPPGSFDVVDKSGAEIPRGQAQPTSPIFEKFKDEASENHPYPRTALEVGPTVNSVQDLVEAANKKGLLNDVVYDRLSSLRDTAALNKLGDALKARGISAIAFKGPNDKVLYSTFKDDTKPVTWEDLKGKKISQFKKAGYQSIEILWSLSHHDPSFDLRLRKDEAGDWPLTESGVQDGIKSTDKEANDRWEAAYGEMEGGWEESEGQAQPKKAKDETKFLRSGPEGFTRAWVLPTGRIAQLGGMWHHNWLADEPEGVKAAKKYGLDIPPFEGQDTEGVREQALRAGFVRVNLNRNNGLMTVEARADDWRKRKAQIEKLVENNLDDIDRLRVSLFNPDVTDTVDSRTADLFKLDTDAEKLAAIPFYTEEPRAAAVRATETPAFRAPEEEPEAPLPPVYSKPEFAVYNSAGGYVGKYRNYGEAERAAGKGGSVKILKTVQGQAQPKSRREILTERVYDYQSHHPDSSFNAFWNENGTGDLDEKIFSKKVFGEPLTKKERNIGREIQFQPSNPRTAIKYFTGEETPEVKGTGFRGRPTLWDAAKFLSEPNAKLGKLGRESEDDLNEHATALADEAEFAFKRDPSAVGWYDAKLTDMKHILEEYHPELKTDPNKFMVYKAMMAINSNGQTIDGNLGRTEMLYRQWKKDGTIDTTSAFGGKNAPAINAGLRNLAELIKAKGLDGAREFLETDFTVGDLKKLGYAIPGELVSAKVKGSVILGPKIGSFYGNLNGDFSSVTMDRWFMRTFNRIGGTLTAPAASPLPKQIQNVLDAFKGRRSDMGHELGPIREQLNEALSGLKSKTMEPEELQDKNSALGQWLYDRFREYEGSRFADRSEQNVSVKNLYENLFGTENGEKPGSGSDRAWIRRVMAETQRQLRERGIELTNADLQALLWYYEKELYAKLYPQSKRGAPTDYAKAAERFVAEQRGQQSRPEQLELGRGPVVEPRNLAE